MRPSPQMLQLYGKVISNVNLSECSLGGIMDAEEESLAERAEHAAMGNDGDPRQAARNAAKAAKKKREEAARQSVRGVIMISHLFLEWPWGELRHANLRHNNVPEKVVDKINGIQKRLGLHKKEGAEGESPEWLLRLS